MHNLTRNAAALALVLATAGTVTAHANVGTIGHLDQPGLGAVFPVDIAPEKLPPIRDGIDGEVRDTETLARSPWIGHQGKFRNR